MGRELKAGDIRSHIYDGKIARNYFIVTELGIEYDGMFLIFRKLGRCYNALSIQSRYDKVVGYPISHTVHGELLRENGECDGILKISCCIPLQMKNYRLAILQEQKKILNILRSKIECRKASVSAKSGTSK